MLVHKYLGASRGLSALRDGELFASRVALFNDPLELAFALTGHISDEEAKDTIRQRLQDPNFVKRIEESGRTLVSDASSRANLFADTFNDWTYHTLAPVIEEIANKSLRMVCFCDATKVKPKNDILMWSHYSTNHEGLRLTLNIPDVGPTGATFFHRVDYRDRRVQVDRRLDPQSPDLEQALRQTLTTKSTAWEYEQEIRLITHPGLCRVESDQRPSKEFVPFASDDLIAVDIGVRASDEAKRDVLRIMKEKYPRAICSFARTHPQEYSLTYEVAEAASTTHQP